MDDLVNEHFRKISTIEQGFYCSKNLSTEEQDRKDENEMIASLNYKINLLSNGFHKWKLHTLQRRVQKRLYDVARVHYEENLLSSFFMEWKSYSGFSKTWRLMERRERLKKVFYFWKNATQLQRVLNQRYLHLAKEYCKNRLLKNMLNIWKEKHAQSKAQRLWKRNKMRHVLVIWKLQHIKRMLQRRLAKYQYKNVILRRSFLSWGNLLKHKQKVRYIVIIKLNKIWLKEFFDRLKSFKEQQLQLSEKMLWLLNKQRLKIMHYCLSLWKHQNSIRVFSENHIIWQRKQSERKYYVEWKGMILSRRFEEQQNYLVLKGYFKQWIAQKREEDTNKTKENLLRRSLNKKKLCRHFHHWRLDTQHELLIYPVLLSAHHKILKRFFDGWLNFAKLQGQFSLFRQTMDIQKKVKVFSKWRIAHKHVVDGYKATLLKENYLLEICVLKWQSLVSHHKLCIQKKVDTFARHWFDFTQQNKELREMERAEQANVNLLKSIYFSKWTHIAQKVRIKRKKMESDADSFSNKRLSLFTFAIWHRQLEVQRLVSGHLEDRGIKIMNNVFSAWLEFTRFQLESQIDAFNQRCDFANSTACSLLNESTKKYPRLSTPYLKRSNTIDGQILRSASTFKVSDKGYSTFNTLERRMSSESVETNDQSFLQGYMYDSEYEISSMHSHEENSNQHSFNSSSDHLESISHTLDPDPSKSFSVRPLSWTDIWKKRYLGSKEVAVARRKSIERDISFQRDLNNSLNFVNGFNSEMSLSNPQPHEVLNRSLPFVRRLSYEDILTSGVYSCDEDAISIASIASTFQSRVKENFMVETIKHWSHHDISRVFYAWLKYTARKKFHKEVLELHLGKKEMYLSHMIFLKWNRQLYLIQVANECCRKQRISRCLTAWKEFTLFQQRTQEIAEKAELFRKTWLLAKCIGIIKVKYNRRNCLNKVANIWKKATSKNSVQEQAIDQHRMRWNKMKMIVFFKQWKEELFNINMANQHHHHFLINKVLHSWWCFVLVRENQRKKILNFQLRQNESKVFKEWRRKLYLIKKADNMHQRNEEHLKKVLFLGWYQTFKVSRGRTNQMEQHMDSRNHSLKKDAFKEWLIVWRQNMLAKEQWNGNLCRKVTISWHLKTNEAKERKTKLAEVLNERNQIRKMEMFYWWKGSSLTSIKYNLKVTINKSALLHKYFISWHKTFLQKKCVEFSQKRAMKKCFHRWKHTYVSKKKATKMKMSSKKWFAHAQATKENKRALERLVYMKEVNILQSAFFWWRKQALLMIDANNHIVTIRLGKTLQVWKEFSQVGKERISVCLIYKKKHCQKLMLSAYYIWKDRKGKAAGLKIVKNVRLGAVTTNQSKSRMIFVWYML